MLKQPKKLKHENFEILTEERLLSILERIPFLKVRTQRKEARIGEEEVDLLVKLEVDGKTWQLMVEKTWNGQPRAIRAALQTVRPERAGRSGL